jgi:hypothetical protein
MIIYAFNQIISFPADTSSLFCVYCFNYLMYTVGMQTIKIKLLTVFIYLLVQYDIFNTRIVSFSLSVWLIITMEFKICGVINGL